MNTSYIHHHYRYFVEEYTDIRHLKQLVFVVRGMVYEATRVLDLPCEIIQYTDSAQTIRKLQDACSKSVWQTTRIAGQS